MASLPKDGDPKVLPSDHTDCGEEPGQAWLLLVEDDAVAARTSARLLRRASGLFVRLAENGNAAERLLQTFGEPTAIVSDFTLSNGENGVAVLERLRGLRCSAPAALFSGAPEAALRALSESNLGEIVPVFSKQDNGAGLAAWLEQLRLCWAYSA